MMKYHVTRYVEKAPGLVELDFIQRSRPEAVYLAFNRMVDDMVRAGAGLDTSHGVSAQQAARRLVVHGLVQHTMVRYRGQVVVLESVPTLGCLAPINVSELPRSSNDDGRIYYALSRAL